ncbi:MAG: hypothetical protein JXR76_20725 [Deltaproteobacteria bacterium]|nr:hypothetical protein [Deltaproteobacteria bacterium]
MNRLHDVSQKLTGHVKIAGMPNLAGIADIRVASIPAPSNMTNAMAPVNPRNE